MKKLISKLKPTLYIALFLMISTVVSGCSFGGDNQPQEEKTITIWSFEDEDIWKPIITELEGELGSHSLVYEKQRLDTLYEERLLNSLLSSGKPDIFSMPQDWLVRHKEKVLPMPQNLTETDNIRNNFSKVVTERGIIDNQVYGLTPTVDTLAVYYNETMIEGVKDEYFQMPNLSEERISEIHELTNEFPETWSKFTKLANLITKKNNGSVIRSAVALGTSNNIPQSEDILYSLMLQNRTKMLSEDMHTATFSLPNENPEQYPGRRALDFYTSFADPKSDNYTWNNQFENAYDAFAKGKTAMIVAYASAANYFRQSYPSFSYSVAALPQIDILDENIVDYASFNLMAVSKLSAFPEASWSTVLKICTDKRDHFSSATKIPTSMKSNEEVVFQERIGEYPFYTQIKTSATWNKGRFPVQVDAIINQAIHDVATGEKSSKNAIDYAASKVTDLLRKEGW